MAQRKETKKTVKVRDLKPKKDAKGGVIQSVSTQASTQARQQGHSIQTPTPNPNVVSR